MTRRTAAVVGAIIALLVLFASASLPSRDLLAGYPPNFPNTVCTPPQTPNCPTAQVMCPLNSKAIYCAIDAAGNALNEGSCQGPALTSCSAFAWASCGNQYYCSNSMSTTQPPTACMQNENACQTIGH